MFEQIMACALFSLLFLACIEVVRRLREKDSLNEHDTESLDCDPTSDARVTKTIHGVMCLIEEYGLPVINEHSTNLRVYRNEYLEIRDMRTLNALEVRFLGTGLVCNIISVANQHAALRIDPERAFYISPYNTPLVQRLFNLIDTTVKQSHLSS